MIDPDVSATILAGRSEPKGGAPIKDSIHAF
jgi:hypothetical protein